MSKRKNKIRWRKSDRDELNKIVRNFNAKIQRQLKKNPSAIEYLPTKIDKKELMNEIQTRDDYNKTIASLKGFLKRGAEKQVKLNEEIVTTRWQRSEMRQAVKDYNNKLKYHKNRYKGNAPYLPQSTSLEKEINRLVDSSDVEKTTRLLKEFLKPDSHQLIKTNRGAIITKWHLKDFEYREERENKLAERERKEIENNPVRVAGVKQDVTVKEMGGIEENHLKERHRNFMNKSQKEIDLFFKHSDAMIDRTNRLAKKYQMRENYLKGLRESGFLDGNSKLEDMIRSLDIEEFIANVEIDKTATFLFYSDPIEWKERMELINQTWRNLYFSNMGMEVEM